MKAGNFNHKNFILEILKDAMLALGTTVARNVEIVLHDLEDPEASVIAVVNGNVSGREVGSPLLSGPDKDIAFLSINKNTAQSYAVEVISNYTTIAYDGRKLNSASTIYHDAKGKPIVAFCVNSDLTQLEIIRKNLFSIQPRDFTEVESKSNVIEQMKLAVDEIVAIHAESGGSIRSKKLRSKIINDIKERGLFKLKGCVGYVAELLDVSRHTIYNDLKSD